MAGEAVGILEAVKEGRIPPSDALTALVLGIAENLRRAHDSERAGGRKL